MINGAHVLLYSKDADADRKFVRDVLRFESVDAGGGWLIFKLPPAELAVHPADGESGARHADHDLIPTALYFMCDNVRGVVESLVAKGVTCAPIQKADWGLATTVTLPSGGEIGLYQPTHPKAI
jgi:hypothetical protein